MDLSRAVICQGARTGSQAFYAKSGGDLGIRDAIYQIALQNMAIPHLRCGRRGSATARPPRTEISDLDDAIYQIALQNMAIAHLRCGRRGSASAHPPRTEISDLDDAICQIALQNMAIPHLRCGRRGSATARPPRAVFSDLIEMGDDAPPPRKP